MGTRASPGTDLRGVDALAGRYACTRDADAREALVRSCEGLVRGIASDYHSANQDEDLVQVGFLGLLNAIEHYDPNRGAPFLAFARHFVRGEIRHYLRDHSAVLRRPRWLDRLNGQIERAVGDHVRDRGRYPGLAELAEVLGMEVESLTEILKTGQIVRTLSLDAEDDNGQPRVDPGEVHRGAVEWLERPLVDRAMLIEALEALNPIQRTVVFYLFFTDLTQADCAARIGVSQKHVSRVLASALHRLRDLLMPAAASR